MIPKLDYYNTNKEQGVILTKSKKKAVRQEDQIMNIFENSTSEFLTPSEIMYIYNELIYKEIILTSVRARVTTLTKKGKLEKTEIMKMGVHGKMEHSWRLPEPEIGQISLL